MAHRGENGNEGAMVHGTPPTQAMQEVNVRGVESETVGSMCKCENRRIVIQIDDTQDDVDCQGHRAYLRAPLHGVLVSYDLRIGT